jgi:glutamyl-tRNA synthetase
LINYLLLLGWSLDDKTEFFSLEEMVRVFSLDRVIKSPASFDPQKLIAFQAHFMNLLGLEEKLDAVMPFLVRAQWIAGDDPSTRALVRPIVVAAGHRLVVAGNILNYPEFFCDDERLEMDESAFDKRIRQPPEARPLLNDLKQTFAELADFSSAQVEQHLAAFVEQKQIKINQIIHALRVALTGKAVGFGMFETIAILGRDRCIRRLDAALDRQ